MSGIYAIQGDSGSYVSCGSNKGVVLGVITGTSPTKHRGLDRIPLAPGVERAAVYLEPGFVLPLRMTDNLPEAASMDLLSCKCKQAFGSVLVKRVHDGGRSSQKQSLPLVPPVFQTSPTALPIWPSPVLIVPRWETIRVAEGSIRYRSQGGIRCESRSGFGLRSTELAIRVPQSFPIRGAAAELELWPVLLASGRSGALWSDSRVVL